MRRLVVGALVACLAACGTPPTGEQPGAEAGDESFLTGGGPAPAEDVSAAVDPSHVGRGALATHWDALIARQLSTAKGSTYRVKEFHRGDRFSLSIVGVAGSLPPPEKARTEVLLVVEGERGVVEMAGKRYQLSAGSVAVFPPGTRGAVSAPRSDPLIGLLVATDRPCPTGSRPYLTSFDKLWSDQAFRTNQDHTARLLTIPGVLSLDAQTVYGFIPPQSHPRLEELVCFLQGEGSFGLGTSGNLVRDGSLLLAPPATPHFFENRKVQGSRCLVLHCPDLREGDTELIIGHPEHEVPEDLHYPGGAQSDFDGMGGGGD